MTELGPIEVTRRSGNERFLDGSKDLGFDLLSFWRWSASNLVSNATRGVLAEYLVRSALGLPDDLVREEWAAWDLTSPEGIKVEVKSAAFIQSWYQRNYSTISFGVRKTLHWDCETNLQSVTAFREADVYVFALLAHKDQTTLNPLDVSQWEFYVLPTRVLDERKRSQHSITLSSLRMLTPMAMYADLRERVLTASRD